MGLDMYLERCKRKGGARAEDVANFERYYSWLNRGEDNKDCTAYDWNGLKDELITPEFIEMAETYKSDIIKRGRYIQWDSLFEEVGYWRKANAIHKFFVDNVQNGEDDCGRYEVPKYVLERLYGKCKAIMELKDTATYVDKQVVAGYHNDGDGLVTTYQTIQVVENPEPFNEILPTCEGFFFGNTDIDGYYFEDIEHTMEILANVIDNTDFEKEMITYQASW